MSEIRNTQFSPRTQRLSQDTDSLSPTGDLPTVLHDDEFWPAEPTSLEDTGLSESLVQSICSQVLLAAGTMSGRKIAESVGLPFGIIDEILGGLRTQQLVAHARSAPLNDYYYSLTEAGQRRTLTMQKVMSYTGPAPVSLSDYLLSVEAQGNQYCPVEKPKLVESLTHISYENNWLDFIGPAVNSNAGIFLYGPPGNGKTTLAKCLTKLRGENIWIPHAIIEDGMIIKVFDAAYHVPKQVDETSSIVNLQNYDRRWIRIERPTVVVGGELTLDNLEVRHDSRSNTCEAPLQLKSNCGSLLIDDFGRQRVTPSELLNRWIVPLENKLDYLTLPTGKKISVPFEQIILFSTNLQPHDLVDEAFLRRVPFKIEIRDPGVQEFTYLFQQNCKALGFPWRPEVVQQLIEGFFKATNRPLRRCYPRDLLNQVKAFCTYKSEPLDLRIDYLRHACRNYFGTLGGIAPSKTDTHVAQQAVSTKASTINNSNATPPPAGAGSTPASVVVAANEQAVDDNPGARTQANSMPYNATAQLSVPIQAPVDATQQVAIDPIESN